RGSPARVRPGDRVRLRREPRRAPRGLRPGPPAGAVPAGRVRARRAGRTPQRSAGRRGGSWTSWRSVGHGGLADRDGLVGRVEGAPRGGRLALRRAYRVGRARRPRQKAGRGVVGEGGAGLRDGRVGGDGTGDAADVGGARGGAVDDRDLGGTVVPSARPVLA